MNAIDIVIIIVLALALTLALLHIHKMRKSGCSCCAEGNLNSGCKGNCTSCGLACSQKGKL